MRFLSVLAISCLAWGGAQAASVEQSDWLAKERFQLRARAIGVLPDASSDVNIGGKADAKSSFMPEVDLTYFITDHIAVEAIASSTRHELIYNDSASLGHAWVLPPTVTLQYHPLAAQRWDPYIGMGLNYSLFYGEEDGPGFNDLQVEGGFGYAVQAGVDYRIDEHWGVNLDMKKLFLNVDAKLNGGAIRADVDLDPWIVGAGVTYRF